MKRIGYIEGERIAFADDHLLRFGTGKDIIIGWDGAKLEILPLTDEVGAINFGNGDKKVDVKIFMSASAYGLFDVSHTRLFMVESDIHIATIGKKLYFGGANVYLCSAGDTALQIKATATSEAAIILTTGAGGGILCEGYLVLKKTDVDCAHEAGLWYKTTGDTLRFKAAAMVHTVITSRGDDGLVQLPSNANLLILGTNELRLRNANVNFSSIGDGQLQIKVTNNADWALVLETATGGCVRIYKAYLLLNSTTTSGAINGQMWYNPTAHQMRCWAGNAEHKFDLTAV